MNKFPLTEVKRVLKIDGAGSETQVQIIKPARLVKRDALGLRRPARPMEAAIRNEGGTASAQIKEVDIRYPTASSEKRLPTHQAVRYADPERA
jgi:hypothetical protein